MAWPDWVDNGTTYQDLRTVANFGMFWNFNTPEKARLTGGLSFFFLLLEKTLQDIRTVEIAASCHVKS